MKEQPLTLEDLALVADGLADSIDTEGAKRLAKLVSTDPRLEPELATLEAVASEAGLTRRPTGEYLSAGHSLDQALQRLVDEDEWTHPADVLDPDASLGVPYEPLIKLARAREQGDPGRMLAIRRRLEEALAAEMAEEALVERFVLHLLELPRERAQLLMGKALQEYRSRTSHG